MLNIVITDFYTLYCEKTWYQAKSKSVDLLNWEKKKNHFLDFKHHNLSICAVDCNPKNLKSLYKSIYNLTIKSQALYFKLKYGGHFLVVAVLKCFLRNALGSWGLNLLIGHVSNSHNSHQTNIRWNMVSRSAFKENKIAQQNRICNH